MSDLKFKQGDSVRHKSNPTCMVILDTDHDTEGSDNSYYCRWLSNSRKVESEWFFEYELTACPE